MSDDNSNNALPEITPMHGFIDKMTQIVDGDDPDTMRRESSELMAEVQEYAKEFSGNMTTLVSLHSDVLDKLRGS